MGEAAPIIDPNDFEERLRADLTLIYSAEDTTEQGPYFALDKGRQADLDRIVDVLPNTDAQGLLLHTLEQIGLLPNGDDVQLYRQQHEYLLHKTNLNESERTIFDHLDRCLQSVETVLGKVHAAEARYQTEYVSGDSLDREKILTLYDKTDEFIGTPLLSVFEKLRMKNQADRDPQFKDKVNQADRVARILILDES